MQYTSFNTNYKTNTQKKKILILVLCSLLIISALAYYWVYVLPNNPNKKAKNTTSQFLSAIYSTNPEITRSLASTELQIVKSDDELSTTEEDRLKIKKVKVLSEEMTDKGDYLVAGTLEGTQPNQPVLKDEKVNVISSEFTMRLIKQEGSWKVDAYQIN